MQNNQVIIGIEGVFVMQTITKSVGNLPIYIFENRADMGVAAGEKAAQIIKP